MSVDGALGAIRTPSAEVMIQSAAQPPTPGTMTGRVRWGGWSCAGIGWVHLVGKLAWTGLEGHTVAAPWGGPRCARRVPPIADDRARGRRLHRTARSRPADEASMFTRWKGHGPRSRGDRLDRPLLRHIRTGR
jgi:hypothetical protein